jgi:hypothetical protein
VTGPYALGRDIRVNSVVQGTSFCFVKATALTADEVVIWTIFEQDSKRWR